MDANIKDVLWRIRLFGRRVRALAVTHWRYGVLGAATLLVAIVALAIFSIWSTPESVLFPVKTRVIEPAVGLFHFTSSGRAAYNTTLLERRFSELQDLRFDSATTSPETLDAVSSLIARESEHALASLDTASLSYEVSLDRRLELLSIVDAHDTLAGAEPEFDPIKDAASAAREATLRSLRSTAEQFASSTPDAAMDYLARELGALPEAVAGLADGSDAERRALSRLEEAQDAIASGDLGDAIVSVLRVRQEIVVDSLLWESQRGPQGDVPDAGPIPEGN